MKNSSITLTAILIISLISVVLFFKNETYTPRNMTEIKEYLYPMNVIYGKNTNYFIEEKRKEKRIKILLYGGVPILILSIFYFYLKSSEDKNDPIKNLHKLKEKQILTDSEFKEKVAEAEKKEILKSQKKEIDKLIAELNNLRDKGILTESEYKIKLNKIRTKNL